MIAATSWPEAVIVVFGIIFVMVVVAVPVWQIFATGRTAISTEGVKEYRSLAEEATATQARTAAALERLTDEVGELRARTHELEKLLKEVG